MLTLVHIITHYVSYRKL